ncbi:response regulator [Pseudochryseolinea flava]|uniref:Response regulatory domain-containing protein n=1 Tax=Pseudochryseolinea flava TaxID=2059302 RepID=A0A364Y4T5_9BACT|nr:response regulator [Pseudochryseolinea flava]RAW02006.1 hypothetical protein DQQ10_05465 [Pseudochryseolinea flava]
MIIMMIDDDPDDRLLFCDAVAELFPEATCVTPHTYSDIRRNLAQTTPDIIFLDGHILPVSCKECLDLIKKLTDRTQTKLVIHSGSLSPNELKEFDRLGVDRIVIKASSYRELKENICNVIEEYIDLKHHQTP